MCVSYRLHFCCGQCVFACVSFYCLHYDCGQGVCVLLSAVGLWTGCVFLCVCLSVLSAGGLRTVFVHHESCDLYHTGFLCRNYSKYCTI